LDRIEEAVTARVLAEIPEAPGRFSHAVIRETLYCDIVPTRRVRCSLKIFIGPMMDR